MPPARPLAVSLLTWFISGCVEPSTAPESVPTVFTGVLQALSTDEEADVIVGFREPGPSGPSVDREARRRALGEVRQSVLQASRGGFVPRQQYQHVAAVAGRISREGLSALSRAPEVAYIQLDEMGHGALTVSVPAILADVAQSRYGVTGKGIGVAVLDSGVNSTHPDLSSSISPTQHCLLPYFSGCPPEFSEEGVSAEDDHGHGSHVAGIITSDGVVAGRGFAPDAEIVAVKVLDRDNLGMTSGFVAGLDWVYDNLSTLNVKIVNLSLVSPSAYGSEDACDTFEPAMAASVKNLVDAGVTIFASSGNDGWPDMMASPACNTGVIAVGATYKADEGSNPASDAFGCSEETTAFDQVTCFTNSAERLDMVAPGAVIESDTLGTGTSTGLGTSFASPTAAGVAALMLECNPSLTPAEVKDILVRTGVPVVDPKNGLTFPSIRADAAVREACLGAAGSSGLGGATGSGGSEGEGTGGTTSDNGGSAGEGQGGATVGSGGATASSGGAMASSGGRASGNGGASRGGATASSGGRASGSGGAGRGGATASSGGRASGGVGGRQTDSGGRTTAESGSAGRAGSGAASGEDNSAGEDSAAGEHSAGGEDQTEPATGDSTPGTTSEASNDSGCGCRVGRNSGGIAWPALASILGALALARRRARCRMRR
jgi:subtilisin family serine protease